LPAASATLLVSGVTSSWISACSSSRLHRYGREFAGPPAWVYAAACASAMTRACSMTRRRQLAEGQADIRIGPVLVEPSV
jgi:hypothetical protein